MQKLDGAFTVAPVADFGHMTTDAAARQRREEAAVEYRPDWVRLLHVAEAPPSDLGRGFYENALDAAEAWRLAQLGELRTGA